MSCCFFRSGGVGVYDDVEAVPGVCVARLFEEFSVLIVHVADCVGFRSPVRLLFGVVCVADGCGDRVCGGEVPLDRESMHVREVH